MEGKGRKEVEGKGREEGGGGRGEGREEGSGGRGEVEGEAHRTGQLTLCLLLSMVSSATSVACWRRSKLRRTFSSATASVA